jgi:hypothetical protein
MAPSLCFNIGQLSYTATSCDDACSILTGNTYYSNYPILSVGAILYSNTGCTVTASTGYYSNSLSGGTDCFIVDSSGVVIQINTCYTTPTPTPTITPTVTPTQPFAVQFQSCEDGSNIFRFRGSTIPTTTGNTYFIDGSKEFTGCATIVPYSGTGILYDSDGITFTSVFDCADGLCPRTNIVSAVLTKCSDGSINYFRVDSDTAFVGAAYLYNYECYVFVRFDGPGGEYIGSPLFKDCTSCTPLPSFGPTPPPQVTPSVTPTPAPCDYTDFCFTTSFTTLSGYSGNYSSTGLNYNSRLYYTGNGTTYGVIYYTGTNWCLSDSLGGTCLLSGKIPCYSSCPDIAPSNFNNGICPTPTPSPQTCGILNFNAYFDCEYTPPVTPTVSIPCDDVDFIFVSTPGIPTPTPSPQYVVGVDFEVIKMSQTPTPSITATPTPTPSNRLQIEGIANFTFIDQQFQNSLTKVIVDCTTNQEYYVGNQLVSGTTTFNIDTILSISINTPTGLQYLCVRYDRDITNISPNSYINEIYEIYGDCNTCQIRVTQTPTPTKTPTPTPTPTITVTPSITPSPTPLPLVLAFNDIINANALVGDASNVNDWNTYFDLPTYGTPFSSVDVIDNSVTLFGGSGITTKFGLFSDDPNLLTVYDYAGCVVTLGDETFGGILETSGVQEVYFPEVTETLCLYCCDSTYGVFGNCHNLVSANIPKLSIMNGGEFEYCDNLTDLIINYSAITYLGCYAFTNCHSLNISADFINCTYIGDYGFQETVFSNYNMPNLQFAGYYSFSFVTANSDLYLPSLTFAGEGCFEDSNFLSVNFPQLTTVGDDCFYNSNISSLYLPSLTGVSQGAFYGVSNVTEFNLPSASVIADYSFGNCFLVKTFNLPSCTNLGYTTGNDLVFDGISGNLITLVVPSALLTCNGGNPDGDIVYLTGNSNTVLITIV